MKDKVSQDHFCPVCNVSHCMELTSYKDVYWPLSNIFNGLSIEFCKACGFGYSVPEIDGDVIDHFYAQLYRGVGSPFFTLFSAMSRPLSHNYRSFAQLILARPFVEFESGDLFIDIGPGSGESFMSATNILENPKMFAVELSDGAAAAYKNIYGIDTFQSIEQLVEYTGSMKIILSSHSLEHFKFKDLELFLEDIKRALSLNGVFIAEVPYVDMRIHSEMRTGDSPHFLFFSKESLKKMLESFGFEVLFLESCGQKYDDWWAEQTSKRVSRVSWLKRISLMAFSALPISAKRVIKKIYGRIHSEKINFHADDFSYGGNRTCLRVVARPK